MLISEGIAAPLQLDQLFGALCEVVNGAVGEDGNHVLDAAAVLAGDIDARLDGHDMTGLKRDFARGRGGEAGRLVDI